MDTDEQGLQDLFSQFGGHVPPKEEGDIIVLLPCPCLAGGGLPGISWGLI